MIPTGPRVKNKEAEKNGKRTEEAGGGKARKIGCWRGGAFVITVQVDLSGLQFPVSPRRMLFRRLCALFIYFLFILFFF